MRVVVANMYVHNHKIGQAVGVLERLQPDLALVCEAPDFHDDLARVGTVHGKPTGSRGARECVVVTSGNVMVEKSQTVQLTEHVGGPPGHPQYWQDRWATLVWCTVDGDRVLAVSWHGNAAIKRRRSPGAVQYAAGMRKLADIVEREAELGWAPVIGGDANYAPPKVGKPWRWSPNRLFGDMGLVVRAHRIDQLVTDPLRHVVVGFDTLADPPGADHDWIVADLRPVRPIPLMTRVERAQKHLTVAGESLSKAAALLEDAGNRPAVQPKGRELAHIATRVAEIADQLPER